MHITVAGKQVETGEALKTHVSDGLAAITGKYFDHALKKPMSPSTRIEANSVAAST